MNELSAFPLYLTVKDVMDMTQYSQSVVYELVKEAETTPGIVIRRGKKGIRIHRDNFFKWYMARSGMTPLEEVSA